MLHLTHHRLVAATVAALVAAAFVGGCGDDTTTSSTGAPPTTSGSGNGDVVDLVTREHLEQGGAEVSSADLGTNGENWFVEVRTVDGNCVAWLVTGVGPGGGDADASVTGTTLPCVDS